MGKYKLIYNLVGGANSNITIANVNKFIKVTYKIGATDFKNVYIDEQLRNMIDEAIKSIPKLDVNQSDTKKYEKHIAEYITAANDIYIVKDKPKDFKAKKTVYDTAVDKFNDFVINGLKLKEEIIKAKALIEAPEVPKKAPEVPKKAPEVPKKAPEVPEVPKKAPEVPKKAPEVPEVPKKAPEVPDVKANESKKELIQSIIGLTDTNIGFLKKNLAKNDDQNIDKNIKQIKDNLDGYMKEFDNYNLLDDATNYNKKVRKSDIKLLSELLHLIYELIFYDNLMNNKYDFTVDYLKKSGFYTKIQDNLNDNLNKNNDLYNSLLPLAKLLDSILLKSDNIDYKSGNLDKFPALNLAVNGTTDKLNKQIQLYKTELDGLKAQLKSLNISNDQFKEKILKLIDELKDRCSKR